VLINFIVAKYREATGTRASLSLSFLRGKSEPDLQRAKTKASQLASVEREAL